MYLAPWEHHFTSNCITAEPALVRTHFGWYNYLCTERPLHTGVSVNEQAWKIEAVVSSFQILGTVNLVFKDDALDLNQGRELNEDLRDCSIVFNQ